jgi:hypothetical protein
VCWCSWLSALHGWCLIECIQATTQLFTTQLLAETREPTNNFLVAPRTTFHATQVPKRTVAIHNAIAGKYLRLRPRLSTPPSRGMGLAGTSAHDVCLRRLQERFRAASPLRERTERATQHRNIRRQFQLTRTMLFRSKFFESPKSPRCCLSFGTAHNRVRPALRLFCSRSFEHGLSFIPGGSGSPPPYGLTTSSAQCTSRLARHPAVP